MKFGQVIVLLGLLKGGTSSTHKAARMWRSELKVWKSKTRCMYHLLVPDLTSARRTPDFKDCSCWWASPCPRLEHGALGSSTIVSCISEPFVWQGILMWRDELPCFDYSNSHVGYGGSNLFGTNIEKYNVLVNGATYSNADNHWCVKLTHSYPVTSHLHRFTSDYSVTLLDTDWRQAASKWRSPRTCTDWSTVEPRFTNAPVHEQFGSRTNFPSKKSRMTNGVSDYEHASWQQRQARVSARECLLLVIFGSVHIPACIRRAFSWISLCLFFFNILLNKTPWDQRRIMIAKLNEVFVYILSV
jgi:hypothetical protein